MTEDGDWTFSAGLICIGGSRLTVAEGGVVTLSDLDGWKWYGAKITLVEPITVDGTNYEPGTLLTLDEDLKWIEVSSWD